MNRRPVTEREPADAAQYAAYEHDEREPVAMKAYGFAQLFYRERAEGVYLRVPFFVYPPRRRDYVGRVIKFGHQAVKHSPSFHRTLPFTSRFLQSASSLMRLRLLDL